jgi:hypothetical protein
MAQISAILEIETDELRLDLCASIHGSRGSGVFGWYASRGRRSQPGLFVVSCDSLLFTMTLARFGA